MRNNNSSKCQEIIIPRMSSFPNYYEEIKLFFFKYLISLKYINSNKHESVTLISRAKPRPWSQVYNIYVAV